MLCLQLRKFTKTCKIPAYTRKMKELIGKITETSKVITERRQTATMNLQDLNAVVRTAVACVVRCSTVLCSHVSGHLTFVDVIM